MGSERHVTSKVSSYGRIAILHHNITLRQNAHLTHDIGSNILQHITTVSCIIWHNTIVSIMLCQNATMVLQISNEIEPNCHHTTCHIKISLWYGGTQHAVQLLWVWCNNPASKHDITISQPDIPSLRHNTIML